MTELARALETLARSVDDPALEVTCVEVRRVPGGARMRYRMGELETVQDFDAAGRLIPSSVRRVTVLPETVVTPRPAGKSSGGGLAAVAVPLALAWWFG